MKSKLVLLLVSVFLVSIMLLSACAASTPAPGPSPSPTPAKPASPVSAPPATAKPETKIEILTMQFGGTGYIAGFTLAGQLNKKSTWLKATAIETKGTLDDMQIMSKERNRIKTLIGHGGLGNIGDKGDLFYSQDAAGNPTWEKYNGKMMWLAQMAVHINTFMVANPNIKTGQDLKGKRLAGPSLASGGAIGPLLKDVWNIYDTVKVDWLGWQNAVSALADGKADASWIGPAVSPTKAIANTASLEQFWSMGKDYNLIPVSSADAKLLREKSGYPAETKVIKAGVIGPKHKQDTEMLVTPNGFFCDAELPDDIAYEIVKTIYENYKEFWAAHASLQGVFPDTISAYVRPDLVHPGALKFYKEKGLKVGP